MTSLTEMKSWQHLNQHAEELRLYRASDFNCGLKSRQQQFSTSASHITIDFSNQRVTEKTLDLLFELAKERKLRDKIQALVRGEKVNGSEGKAALHTALRAPSDRVLWLEGRNVMIEIAAQRQILRDMTEQIRAQQWLGSTGKVIRDIVNIGIGGSDLGMRFCIKALANFSLPDLGYHFISDADPYSFKNTVAKLNPETTLFIIASKSFTTKETLFNMQKAIKWLGSLSLDQHLIAVTANVEKARNFGIKHSLAIWEWVGGRYSLCSATNLITMIAIGFEQFNELLQGAHSMDRHFQDADFAINLPVLLGLLGVWNNNFLHIHNLLILSYSKLLEQFVPYIQQLDMESNGKSIDNQGRAVSYATGPIIWGGNGNQAQHSYYQLICQGTHQLTADFISLKQFDGQLINEMRDSKMKILTQGVPAFANPDSYIPGNIPLNHIQLENYSPFTVGALIALYEHKIYTQAVIWNINPFDQPGVEAAKCSLPMIDHLVSVD